MIPVVILAFFSFLFFPCGAVAQSLKEIRIGSSDITVSNLCTFYARDRRFFEAEGIDVKIIIVKQRCALPWGGSRLFNAEYIVHRSHAKGHAVAPHRRDEPATLLGLLFAKASQRFRAARKQIIDQFFRRRYLWSRRVPSQEP